MTNYNRDQIILCKTFVQKTKEFLSKYSKIQHTFSINDEYEGCILDIPKQSENGFDIAIQIDENNLNLSIEGSAISFDNVQDSELFVQEILVLLRDLLSPTARIIGYLSDDKSYKWTLEIFRNGKWECGDTRGLLFYNYFGKKTQKIYQNDILPSRDL